MCFLFDECGDMNLFLPVCECVSLCGIAVCCHGPINVCYTVTEVTNVFHQVDHLSSPTAPLVNEVREPQSTQSSPLPQTWTNRKV